MQKEGAQFFSRLDLTSFFYQIRVEPEDVPLASIRTIMGCMNPATACRRIHESFKPLQEQPGFTVDEAGS
jgi:hypothetical protein